MFTQVVQRRGQAPRRYQALQVGTVVLGGRSQTGRHSQAIIPDEVSRLRCRCLPPDRGRPPTGLG